MSGFFSSFWSCKLSLFLFVCILYLYHLALGNAANPILAHLEISVSEDAVFILITLRCLSYA